MKCKDVQATIHIKALVIFFGVIFTCFVWTGLYFVIQTERQLEIGNTFKEAANYARMFEEHTVRTIKGLDQVAISIKFEVEKEGFNIDLRRLVNEGRFSGQPFVALGVLDKNGELVASSQEIVSRINNSDLEFFQVHKMEDNAKLYVGKPLLGRASGKWLLQMSRRINLSDGSFGGVVVVGVDPYYFAQFYKQVDLGEKSVITFVGHDGIVRVRQSGEEVTMGLDLRQRMNNEFSRGVAGHYTDISIGDGVKRLFSYRNLAEYPLTVVVGASEDYVFQGLNKRIMRYLIAGGVLSLLVIIFVAALLSGIARRSQVEKALRQSEDKYRHLFKMESDALFLIDAQNGKILEANEAAVNLYGYSNDELLQMRNVDLSAEPEETKKAGENAASSGVVEIPLRYHRKKDGTVFPVEINATSLQWNGRPVFIPAIRDITERVRTEERLRESENRFRSYFQDNKSVMLLVDKETFDIIDANPAAADFYGYSLEQLKQMKIMEIYMLPPIEIAEKIEMASRRHENAFLFPHRLASGEIRQVEVYSTPIRIGQKEALHSIIHDVTERVELEEKVREREANFFGFFNTVEDFLFVLDVQGGIIHMNQIVLNRLEYQEDELTGQSVLMVHPVQRRAEAGRIVEKMLAGTADSCLVPLISKSGEQIPVETRVTAGTWNGKPALFGVSKDLSALKISEEKLAKVFETTSSLMAVSTLEEGIFLDVNQAFLSTLGFDRTEVVGKRSVELQIFEHPEVRDKIFRKLQQDGAVRNIEVQLRTKDGRPLIGMFSVEIVEVAAYRLLITTMNDVTELKQAEQKLRESEARLRDSEQKLKDIIVGTKMGTWEWNIQTGETVFNERWAEIVGYTLAELKPTSIATWQRFAHPEDLIHSSKLLQEHFEGRTPYYACDSRVLHKDGHWVWVFDSGKVMKHDEEGNPLLMSGTHIDITDRKQAEVKLLQSEQRYKSLMMQAFEAVALFDLETLEITEVNPAFEKMTGYRFPFEKPMNVFDFIVDDPVNIMRYLDETHTNGVLQPTLRKIRIRDGSIREVERNGNLIQVGDKQYQFTTFRDVTEEKRHQQEMHSDLILAAQVQRVLLPAIPRSAHFKISTVFEPQGFVSGDFYHLEWRETEQVLQGFLIDITGHGLATALQTAAVNVLLHQLSDLPQEVSLSERLSWLNHRIPQYIDESTFAAAICFEFDFSLAQLRYASAGINYFLYNGERIEVAGMYLGIRDDETYELHSRPIRQGDAVCFMTDGISDVFDRENNWGTIGAGQLCSLFHEGTWTEKTQDDSTAVCIEVSLQQSGDFT